MRPFDREVNDGGDANTEWGHDSDEDADFIPDLLTAGIDSDDDTEDGDGNFPPGLVTAGIESDEDTDYGEGNFSPQLATAEGRLERPFILSRLFAGPGGLHDFFPMDTLHVIPELLLIPYVDWRDTCEPDFR